MRWRILPYVALLSLACDPGAGEPVDAEPADGSPLSVDAGRSSPDAEPSDTAPTGPDATPDPSPDAAPDAAPPEARLPPRMGIAGLGPPGNVAAMAERGDIEWTRLRAERTPAGEIDVERLLDGIDCLVLPGGDDIDPALYGEAPHPTVRLISPARAELDFAVLRGALDRGLPILGLCLGGQQLTVALGGSLVQDIPSEIEAPLDHRSLHPITFVDGSLMAELYGVPALEIFSNHHQAADAADMGRGLRVSARSADGVVEAFEAIDRARHPFVVGTQYHPERQLESGAHDGLVAGFRAACLAYQAANPRMPSAPDHGQEWEYGACQSDVGPGVCLDVAICAERGGVAAPGFCPGPAAIQCCSDVLCVDGSGQAGECISTDLCDQRGRARVPWLCPGDSTVQCCLEDR